MNKERSWMFLEELIQKTETSLDTKNMARSISNGILFMLMNGRENPKRENSMKTLVFTSKETSMLFPNSQITDILT